MNSYQPNYTIYRCISYHICDNDNNICENVGEHVTERNIRAGDFNNTNPSIVELELAMTLYIWQLIDAKITLEK